METITLRSCFHFANMNKKVTLLLAAKDRDHNNALVLREYLVQQLN